MWPFRKARRVLARYVKNPIPTLSAQITMTRRKADADTRKNTVLSMLLVLFLVALFLPWQIAFLGCWALHLVTCTTYIPAPPPGDAPTPPLRSTQNLHFHTARSAPHNAQHILPLPLPLTAPIVLVVWARTLITAGVGAAIAAADHNVWAIAPYLVLVDFASWTCDDALFPPDR